MSLKAVWLFAWALTSSCNLFAPRGPSHVARGEYYGSGKPDFDSFFIELHQKQVELLTAPDEPADVRKSLAQALGLTADASDDSLSERLDQEVKKLAARGLRLRLEVPEASAAVDASATLHTSDDTTSTVFRSALPTQATRLVRSRNRMLATKSALDRLRVAGITLDGNIDTTFRVEGPWKRDEVRRNLDDGQKVITLMQARTQEVADSDQKLLSLLASVATTLNKVPSYPTPPGEDGLKTGSKRSPAPKVGEGPKSGPASKADSARPPTAKPKPPSGSDDGPPLPKPTQGSAPAEIEP